MGWGFFITFVGLTSSKIIVKNDSTLIQLVDFSHLQIDDETGGNDGVQALVFLFSFFVLIILSHFNVPGSIIISIIAGTILGIPLKVSDLDVIAGKKEVSWKFWVNFQKFFSFSSSEGAFGLVFKDGFKFPPGSALSVIVLILTFTLISLFETMVTAVACCKTGNLMDENNIPKNYDKILYTDSISSFIGGIFGSSTVTFYVESFAGVAIGGKTGFTALIIAIMFLIAIFYFQFLHLFRWQLHQLLGFILVF